MLSIFRSIILFCCLLIAGNVFANQADPIQVNAIITSSQITFEPASIPENTPFIVHVINKSGVPVELENADTSVEVYAGMDKTFKIGLTAGKYKFFNDFNPKTKTAELHVLTAAQIASGDNKVVASGNINAHSSAVQQSTTAPSASSTTVAGEIVFIMWREGIEALLVVGIVFGWLRHLKYGRKEGMIFLASGVVIGVLCALGLGFILIKVNNDLSMTVQQYLQAGLTFAASIMIVYMVKWMRSNGAKLKSEMQNALSKNESRRWNVSILVVVAVAIAREGSEAVIFIYALGFGEHGVVTGTMIGAVIVGLCLAILTAYILSLGNKIFSWRYFFKITEIILLLLGGALLLNCIDILITAGVLPVLKANFWDTSFILGNDGKFLPILTSMIGYKATPSLMDILVYIAYWVLVLKFIKNRKLVSKKV